MEQIYIYVSDQFGTDPYLTTLPLFQAELSSLFKDEGWGSPPELVERQWHENEPPIYTDGGNTITLAPATLENLTRFTGWIDSYNLLGWAIAQDLARLIEGHLGRGVGFGELRRAVEMYEEVAAMEEEYELYAEELPEEKDIRASCVRPNTPKATQAEWMNKASRDAGIAAREREIAQRK